MTTQELSALFNLAQRALLSPVEALWLDDLYKREAARVQAEEQAKQQPAEPQEDNQG